MHPCQSALNRSRFRFRRPSRHRSGPAIPHAKGQATPRPAPSASTLFLCPARSPTAAASCPAARSRPPRLVLDELAKEVVELLRLLCGGSSGSNRGLRRRFARLRRLRNVDQAIIRTTVRERRSQLADDERLTFLRFGAQAARAGLQTMTHALSHRPEPSRSAEAGETSRQRPPRRRRRPDAALNGFQFHAAGNVQRASRRLTSSPVTTHLLPSASSTTLCAAVSEKNVLTSSRTWSSRSGDATSSARSAKRGDSLRWLNSRRTISSLCAAANSTLLRPSTTADG